MAVALCMVLLTEAAPPSAARIEEELRKRHPDLDSADVADEDGTASLKVRDGTIVVALMPAPIPWSDLEGPCATSLLWKNAADEVRQHSAHFIVTVLSELDELERAILLTKVTTAVLATCDAAMGVYWGNATLVIPKPVFIEFAEQILPDGPPLPIWIDFRVGWQAEKRSAGFTQGLAALGHMELEAEDWPEKPSDLLDRFQGLALYLLNNGPVIKDGDSVGQSASEKIRVVYGKSNIGHKGLVMHLRYESAHRPWWKIW